ncbi:helix-turn-helix domain-containing protein [Actinomadura sp. WMMA1423]|uniref:MarR family transcriptional regulator n=1 Tax=Actinomadura sp. WMMA1423 TaxID=2591108 RepID=UPI00143E0AE7|nr:helix-turn-helix domain-containing protein [Actinomadura sp. WMMA1423]
MTAKNITANGAAGNGATGNENAGDGAAVTGGGARPSGAAGDVWDALTGNPGATVTALAEASGVSRATVARTLTTLERDGYAVRTRGGRDGGKRQPDTWHPVTATTGDTPDASASDTLSGDADATADTEATTEAPTTDDTATGTDAAPEAPAADEDAPTSTDTATTGDADANETTDAGDAGAGMDAAAVAEARDALTGLQDAIAAALTALDGGDGAGALAAVEGVYGGSGKARRLVRAAANGRPRTASGAPRSAPGEMRAKVAGHLTGHPGAAFTPHEIAKVIGHSAGAVSNALDRLTEAGEAELVCDRPRRFTAITARPAKRAAR